MHYVMAIRKSRNNYRGSSADRSDFRCHSESHPGPEKGEILLRMQLCALRHGTIMSQPQALI